MNILLEIKNLSAAYNGETVLDDVNLRIREGDFMGVIGPNGGGKTTLLKIILGVMEPFRGEVVFNDALLTRKKIGYLPQMAEGDINFPLSVRDVVLSGLMMEKKSSGRMTRDDRKRASEVINDLGITRLEDKNLSELSGGELQRVYLARALVGSPSLLLLDEPGNFVDSSFELGFYDMLKDLNKTVTILMVSHDVGTISAYVKSFACVNRHLHFHDSGKITTAQLKDYNCPIQLIAHGDVPHTVLETHE